MPASCAVHAFCASLQRSVIHESCEAAVRQYERLENGALARACTACNGVKAMADFPLSTTSSDGHGPVCAMCQHLRSRSTLVRFSVCKSTALRRGLRWSLSYEKFAEVVAKPCHYCGGQVSGVGYSLDRVNDGRGYESGNVVVCCWQCKRTRSESFTALQKRQLTTRRRDTEFRVLLADQSDEEFGDTSTWCVRGVSRDIQSRIRVQAEKRGMFIGELLSQVLRGWLNSGASDEDLVA